MGNFCNVAETPKTFYIKKIMSPFVPEICGHGRQLNYLSKLKKRGALPHAFLFAGPDGVGKKETAIRFAASPFCSAVQAALPFGFGCGSCGECIKIREGRHPDVLILQNNERIGIEDVREVRRHLALRSYYGKNRAVIIDDAHNLSAEAQAALLKTIEEPNRGTFFFLIASSPHFLFETIRSRAVPVAFGLVDEENLRRHFESLLPKKDAGLMLKLAEGRPGRLINFLGDDEFFRKERAGEEKFRTVLKKDLVDQFDFAEKHLGRGRVSAGEFLFYLINQCRPSYRESNFGRENIARLKTLLDLYWQVQFTNANQRLIVDSALITVKALKSEKLS